MIILNVSNSTDLASVRYAEGFQQELLIPAKLSAPEWRLEQEGEQDGDLREIYTLEKWQKRRSFELLAHEFLTDALYLLPLHDNVQVNGHQVHAIEIEHEQQDDTLYNIVTVSFATAEVVKRISDTNYTKN